MTIYRDKSYQLSIRVYSRGMAKTSTPYFTNIVWIRNSRVNYNPGYQWQDASIFKEQREIDLSDVRCTCHLLLISMLKTFSSNESA